jgi:Secretion system C-terminal sorting domain
MKKLFFILFVCFIGVKRMHGFATPSGDSYVTVCNHTTSMVLSMTFNAVASEPGDIQGESGWRWSVKASGGTVSNNATVYVNSLVGSGTVTFRIQSTQLVGLYAQLQYKKNNVWYTYSTQSPTVHPFNTSAYMNTFNCYTSNSNSNFTVNSTSQTGTEPATFYKCTAADPLNLYGYNYGSISKYQIKVEKGLWSGGVFTSLNTYTSSEFTATTIPANTDLNLLFTPNLNNYTGYIRVTLTTKANAACGSTAVSKVQIFKVESNSTNVNFQLHANGCGGVTGINRTTILPITDATFTASPCIPGWQGAATGAVANANFTGVNGTILSSTIRIEEVNPTTGLFISLIGSYTKLGTPDVSKTFNSVSSPVNFFLNNYSLLSTSNRTFKVIYTINTASCSNQEFAYFRIAGGPGGNGYRIGNTDDSIQLIEEVSELQIYPNPSNGLFNIVYSKLNSNSYVEVFNNVGKSILIDENIFYKGILDLNDFSDGIYFYNLNTGSEKLFGKLVKN